MERKEPTFSGISSSSSEPVLTDTQTTKSKAAPVKKPQKARPAPVSSTPPAAPKGSPLAVIALLIALIAAGLSGYLFTVLMQTQKNLADAGSRILELQQALQLSGDESTQSVATLQANLRKQQGELGGLRKALSTSEHEIRKLWDTRNVNKKAIAANKKLLDSQVAKTKSLPGDVKNLQSKLDSQSKLTQSAKADAGQALENTMLLSASMEQQQQTVRELVDAGSQMENTLLSLKKQVQGNEEAIRSIDAFRKNTNSELWKLKQQSQPAATTAR